MCKKSGIAENEESQDRIWGFYTKRERDVASATVAKPPSAMSAKRIDGSRMRDTTGPDLRGGPGMMGREVEKSTCCS